MLFLTTRFRMPSFIVTLGIGMFIRGLIYFATYGFILPIRAIHPIGEIILFLINGKYGFINTGLFWYFSLGTIFTIILYYTSFGNHVMSVGGNPLAALYSGVNVKRVKTFCFIISSLLASFGGLLSAARLRIGSPTSGMNLELEAIAAAVIGGVSLSGGIGSVPGIIIGTLTISMIRSGLVLAGAPVYWYIGFIGLILILASLLQSLIRGVKE